MSVSFIVLQFGEKIFAAESPRNFEQMSLPKMYLHTDIQWSFIKNTVEDGVIKNREEGENFSRNEKESSL